MIIGKRIKLLRIQKRLSQEELGNYLGVTKVSICGYEKGKRVPNADNLEKLANFLVFQLIIYMGEIIMLFVRVTIVYYFFLMKI